VPNFKTSKGANGPPADGDSYCGELGLGLRLEAFKKVSFELAIRICEYLVAIALRIEKKIKPRFC